MEQLQSHDDGAVELAGLPVVTEPLSFARFTRWSIVIAGFGALLIMLFVALVDSYHLFGIADIPGFNHLKPRPEQYRQQIKIAQVKAIRPNVLLLGNSRIEVGLDPESPQLLAHRYSAYNLALAGTSLTDSQRAFDQARRETAPPAMAVIGVEFLDFLVSPNAVPAAPPKAENRLSVLQWRFDTLFSMKALSDAFHTLRLQKASDPETMTSRGHTPLLEYRQFARQEGYHQIFQQRAQENAKNIVRKPHGLYGANGSSDSIDRLRQMLDTMAQDGTEVKLVIYPYHAQLMAMFEEGGLLPAMKDWKHLLVREVEAARTRHPQARMTLWDFSGYSPLQCERIPAPGDLHSTTRFYWEGGHFKSTLGELVLRRMLGEEGPFGLALTAANFEQNEQRMAAERDSCATAYPEVFAGARSLILTARPKPR